MRGTKNEIVIRGINRIIYKYQMFLNKHLKKNSYNMIIMFHDITLDMCSKDKKRLPNDFSVSFKRFTEVIERILNKGYRFVSLDELLNSPIEDKLCVLSFDDAFQGVYTYAFPYLEKNHIPFILYIASGFLNQKGYLMIDNLKEMSASSLCTVGSHTVNHVMTRFVSREILERELKESKEFLERVFGKKVSHFAFPYGSPRAFSYFDIKYIKSCGYESAATTFQYYIGKKFKNWNYLLPRYDASGENIFEII